MHHRPLDPNEDKFSSDKNYEKAVDVIQNERYADYIFWQKTRRFLTRLAFVFLFFVILYIWLIK